MARGLSRYHQQVTDQNRAAILDAATTLLLEHGYDQTSLARVATTAGVSKATLFKQFPTKAALFEATVLAVGEPPETTVAIPPLGDLEAGLVTLGLAYAALLTRPRTADLIRLVISEGHRFPDLRERVFDFGTVPVLMTLSSYLSAARTAGDATADAPTRAPSQFLGMIASAIFWPQLVHPTWSIVDEETRDAVEQAARTIVARYGTRTARDHASGEGLRTC